MPATWPRPRPRKPPNWARAMASRCSSRPSRRNRSLQFEHHGSRYWIGHAQTAAQIFERIAERIERCDHVRARLGERVHVAPLGDDAIAAVAGLDHVDVLEAGPIGMHLLVRIEEFLVAPRLDPE